MTTRNNHMKKYLLLFPFFLFCGGLLDAAEEKAACRPRCRHPSLFPRIDHAGIRQGTGTVRFPDHRGRGRRKSEKKTENVLPGIEILKDADLAIFFMRFLKLPDQEWAPIEAYLKSGKPVIGLRTANHSFKYAKEHPRFKWNDDFGRRALGTPYVVHQGGTTDIQVVPKYRSHPIMKNIDQNRVGLPRNALPFQIGIRMHTPDHRERSRKG